MEEPWIEIIEEPKKLEHRFRYKCEGNRAGSILGENSTDSLKSSPTIKIHNMGPNAVVVVSCVSRNEPYFPHPHSLVGDDCNKGVCIIRAKGSNIVKLDNVGVQCCRRQDINDAVRIRRENRVDPFQTGHDVDKSQIDLFAVRLCFQVFLPDANKKFTRVVKPVVTQEIIDKRKFNKLDICRLSRQSAFARGGEEVMILCDKVKRGDIQVRFFEVLPDGSEWEAFGSLLEVHRQYAVTCNAPHYWRQSLSGPASVWVQLFCPSDNTAGEPKPFQFIPNEPDQQSILSAKRRKIEQRGINISNNSISTGSIPSFLLQDSLLSYDEHLAGPSAGLSLMNIVGLTNPSHGFTSLPPPYPDHANAYTSDEDDLRIVTDLVDLVNNEPPGQQQVNLENYMYSEGNFEVNSHHDAFIDFAQTGQQQVNLMSYASGQDDLETANHQDAFVRIAPTDQGQVNLGFYTSNEEVNDEVTRRQLVNNALTGQQRFNQTEEQVVYTSSQANTISDLSKVEKPFPAGTVIKITQDPVETTYL